MTVKKIAWNSKEYWEGIYLRNILLKKSAGKEYIEELPFAEKNDIHFVAIVNDKVVGTLMLSKVDTDTAQVKQVAVSTMYQGVGIGKQLVNFAEKAAQSMGITTLYLMGRRQAWKFYELFDYKSYGEIYQDGCITFKKFYKIILPEKIYLLPEIV